MAKQLDALTELATAKEAYAVCRAVMAALGRPAGFLRVTARQVTEVGHRVNVIVGGDPSSARIAHSYFVTTDAEGNLAGSAPPIVRLYGPAGPAAPAATPPAK